MIQTVPDILARIVAKKREELASPARPFSELEALAEAAVIERRSFVKALRKTSPAVIAEIKKASPSKGVLQADFAPARQAEAYAEGGAAALSVLTDHSFFQGSMQDLAAARTACALPILRKDFTLDSYNVLEAAAGGADAILLIAAILSSAEIRRLRELAAKYGMDSLVEVHNREELAAAIDAGAEMIGVNNRDLATFEVSIETSLRLAAHLPPGTVKISESGIHSRADVERLSVVGYDAFLVGEALMKSGTPAAALRALAGRA